MKTAAKIRRYKQGIRWANHAIAAARSKLAMLWPLVAIGLSWAKGKADDMLDIIDFCRYGIEDDHESIRRLRKYGTAFVMIRLVLPSRDNSYDGWLSPEDRYQEGQG
jgi:hypothetical protein